MKTSVMMICLVLLMTACNKDRFDDDSAWPRVNDANQAETEKTVPVSYETIELPAMINLVRNPFVWEQNAEHRGQSEVSVSHAKDPLEQFALDKLKMVGALLDRQHTWALIKAQDKIIYHIQSGQHIGLADGVVEKISINNLEIAEPSTKRLADAGNTVMTLSK